MEPDEREKRKAGDRLERVMSLARRWVTAARPWLKKSGWVVAALAVGVGGFFVGWSLQPAPSNAEGVQQPTRAEPHEHDEDEKAGTWTCSMHPEVQKKEPGECPYCGMALVPVERSVEKPAHREVEKEDATWTCSMHPQIQKKEPGKCPICGMALVPVERGVEEDGTDGVLLTLSERARRLAQVRTSEVVRRPVHLNVSLSGKVAYDERRVRRITAWTAGRVEKLYVDYTGDRVRKGRRMARLYSPELIAAQSELIQASRTRDALKESVIESVKRSSDGLVRAARRKLRLLGLTKGQVKEIEKSKRPNRYVTIFAPAEGVVIKKLVEEGDYVNAGTPLYAVADLSRVWVILDAYEEQLVYLEQNQEVSFEVEAYPGRTFTGKVAYIEPFVRQKSRTVRVRLTVQNEKGRLKPEMLVRATVDAGLDGMQSTIWTSEEMSRMERRDHAEGEKPKCHQGHEGHEGHEGRQHAHHAKRDGHTDHEGRAPLVIPRSAPLITGKRAIVFVEVDDRMSTYEPRQVELGPRAGDHYVVLSGLEEGERVVTHGAFKLDASLQIQGRPSMMSPKGGGGGGGHHH